MTPRTPSPAEPPAAGRGRLLLRLLGPCLLVLVVWQLDDKEAMVSSVAAASAGPLVAAVLLCFAPLVLKVLRWRALLAARGYRYGLKDSLLAVSASIYLGMVTPGRMGDVVRVQYVRRDIDTPYAEGLAVTVVDRVCDIYALIAFVGFGFYHLSSVMLPAVSTAVGLVAALGLFGPLLFVIPGVAERLFGPIYRKLAPSGSNDNLERFLASLRAQVGRTLVAALALSVGAFFINYAQGWLIARALGLNLSFADVTSLLAITSLLGLLPISISGLGVREAFFSLVFPVLGLGAAQGIGFGLVVFACLYVMYVLIGLVAWQVRPPPA